jgi:general stress protein YciG
MDITKEMEIKIMAGTLAGGKKAAAANLARDPDFYKKIGGKGGATKNPLKGFGGNKERARTAGAKGGKISKRRPRNE